MIRKIVEGRESNTAHATTTSDGEWPRAADPEQKSPGYAEGGNSSIPVSICEWRGWCNEVAEPIVDALSAIDAGRVEIARERLEALLRMMR
jgi:hypothetical protein